MLIPQKVRNTGYLGEGFVSSVVSRNSDSTVAIKSIAEYILQVLSFMS